MSSKVSFTIRRPSANADRAWGDHNDSSDDGEAAEDELVTGFDKFGVQRQNGERKKATQEPLVIPALKNRDWKELARKRRGGSQYVPPSAAAQTGSDGTVGGLGTKDTINSGPLLSGLQVKKRESLVEEWSVQEPDGDVKMGTQGDEVEETEDQRAIRALLAETNGETSSGPMIDIIPPSISETDALKQDVEELPDAATLEDYARVPVSQFGAALLRGMGWKEGTAATRKPGRGMVEPYLPASRPALLGIGAKEMEVMDDGSNKRRPTNRRPERYMPLVRQEREGASTPASSGSGRERSRSPRRREGTTSRTRSPDRRDRRNDRDQQPIDSGRRERDRERGQDRDRNREYPRDRDRGYPTDRNREYDRERRNVDSDRDQRRGDSDRNRRRDDSGRARDRSRESTRRRGDY